MKHDRCRRQCGPPNKDYPFVRESRLKLVRCLRSRPSRIDAKDRGARNQVSLDGIHSRQVLKRVSLRAVSFLLSQRASALACKVFRLIQPLVPEKGLLTESSLYVRTEAALRETPSFTKFAFGRLLEWLDDGGESNGETYLEIRRRLVLYFDRRNRPGAEDLADETLSRVARTLEQSGRIVTRPPARYCYVVARFVLLEDVRRDRRHVSLDEPRRYDVIRGRTIGSIDSDETSTLREQRLECLDPCLPATASGSARAGHRVLPRLGQAAHRTSPGPGTAIRDLDECAWNPRMPDPRLADDLRRSLPSGAATDLTDLSPIRLGSCFHDEHLLAR